MAGQSVVVLGLGRFGEGLALELMSSGCEVLGIDAHETILRQLGVEHVVHPERDMGRRLAHLVRVSMEDYVEVEPGFVIVRTGVPHQYVGRELAQTRMRAERGVSVVAVKDQGRWLYPDRDYVLQQGDTLLVAGPTGKAEAFAQLH